MYISRESRQITGLSCAARPNRPHNIERNKYQLIYGGKRYEKTIRSSRNRIDGRRFGGDDGDEHIRGAGNGRQGQIHRPGTRGTHIGSGDVHPLPDRR